eukprot:s1660_g8.t1
MKEAKSAKQFISILEEALDGTAFNDFHASAAYHSPATRKRKGELRASDGKDLVLPKLNDRFKSMLAHNQVSPRALATVVWSVAHLSNAMPNILDIVPELAAQITLMAKDMNSRELSNSLWAAATLKEVAPDLLKMVPALVAQILLTAKNMNAQDVSNNLWAAATLKEAAPDVLKGVTALVAQVPLVTKDMKAQELSNSLWATATLKEAAPDVLKGVPALVAQVPAIAKNMKAQELSNSLWATATLKEAAPYVLKGVPALVAQVPMVVQDMKAQELSNSLWATATLKEAAPDVLKGVPALVAQVPMVAKDMKAQHLSNSLWSAATLKEAAPDVLQMVLILVAEIFATRQSMNAQDVSNNFWAAATLKEAAPDVLKVVPALVAQIPVVVEDMKATDLSMSLLGILLLSDSVPEVESVLSPGDGGKGNFVLAAAERFNALFPKMTETDFRRAVPIVVWACARSGVRHDQLLASVSQHFGSAKKCSSLSNWSLCALQWSYDELDSKRLYKDFRKSLKTNLHRRSLSVEDVDSCREGWRICLAMARVPGESLDSWLRKRGNKQQQDGPSSVRRGCALAIALLRQLGPTLSRISSHVWHRDVNSHNILISVAEGSSVEDEAIKQRICHLLFGISNRVSFWLIDFGLAVESQSWPQKWHNTDVAGDCRYWAPSSFVMSFCGPEEGSTVQRAGWMRLPRIQMHSTAASPDFCSQYKTKLDIVGLGLTALELLCSTALASKETWGPDGLRGSWERLLDTWERYREDVTRWHSMIFQVFTKGGTSPTSATQFPQLSFPVDPKRPMECPYELLGVSRDRPSWVRIGTLQWVCDVEVFPQMKITELQEKLKAFHPSEDELTRRLSDAEIVVDGEKLEALHATVEDSIADHAKVQVVFVNVTVECASKELSGRKVRDLRGVRIPDTEERIGIVPFAFEGCRYLLHVEIPESVTEIGHHAFRGCSSLLIVNIPESVTKIPDYAFAGCSSLRNLTIPESVTELGYRALNGCSSLTSLTLPSVTHLGHDVFSGCSSLTNLAIPSATRIGFDLFSGCSSLTSLTIPDRATGLGDRAFSGCSSLTTLTIPRSVTEIQNFTFANCRSLTIFTIPSSVTSIGADAFRGCISLTALTIPNSVTRIGDRAFDGCSSLVTLSIPDSVRKIGADAFRGCSSLDVRLPKDLRKISNGKGGFTLEDASPRSIEKAWRQKARQLHPDKAAEDRKAAAEESFKRLSEAHDLLADPERRELYDRFGIQDPNVLPQDQWDFGEGMGGHPDFAEFEEILKEFFQNGRGGPGQWFLMGPARRVGRHLRLHVDLSDRLWRCLPHLAGAAAAVGRSAQLVLVEVAFPALRHWFWLGPLDAVLVLRNAAVLAAMVGRVERWQDDWPRRHWAALPPAWAGVAIGDGVAILCIDLNHSPHQTKLRCAAASQMWRLTTLLLSYQGRSESCWSDGYSAELCCDTQTFGPGGNAGCWDGSDFTYRECCCDETQGCWVPQVPQAAPWGHWEEPPLGNPVEELSVGLFPTYEPGKDCWTGSSATYAKCCDLAINPMGNIWNCWDNNRFTFERCCFLGEAALDEPPPKPLLRRALRAPASPKPREQHLFLRPAGQECWVHGFTYAACCLAGINSCWDEIFTHASCCDGRPQLPQAGPIVKATDPIVNCLELSSHLTLDLEQRPRQCPQRYFYLATMGTALIGADRKGIPWWYPSDDVQMVKPLRPQRMHFVGGICVPSTCSVEATATYLAPLVAPWWRSPRAKAQPLNASHVTLPPPLAVRHKAFGDAKAKINLTFSAWTALRPVDGEALADLDRWDFAMIPYRASASWSKGKAMLIWTAFGAILLFGAIPRGVDIENFLSPSFHLLRLGLPRGPKHLELIRLVLTMLVLVIHVMDHGPWTPVQQHSGAAYLMLLRSCMSRVNIGFVVLLVHLSISRRSLKQAISLWGWMRGMAFHTLKRLFVIAPVVGAWSLVFVQAPFDDVPMNNILKSNPLYLWYGERRDQCENTFQLVCSVLFIHAPVMGVRSPCHNTDIFERNQPYSEPAALAKKKLAWHRQPRAPMWPVWLLVTRAMATGWDYGWQPVEPAEDSASELQKKLDQAHHDLASCRADCDCGSTATPQLSEHRQWKWIQELAALVARHKTALLTAAAVTAVAIALAATLALISRKTRGGGLQHLRLPLTEAAGRRRCWRLPLGLPSWCRLPRLQQRWRLPRCPQLTALMAAVGSLPGQLWKQLKGLGRFCFCCAESDASGRVPWRQRAQNARQSLQQAQEQLDVALGEAQIRLTDALKRAERAEAESKQLRKFLQESNVRVEVAESVAKKCRDETEELKVSFRRAEETATKARQELHHARRRAEVAEAIAARCEASAKAAAVAASVASSRSPSASPGPEASPKPKAPSPAPRSGSATRGAPGAPGLPRSAKARSAPRRESLRSSRGQLEGSGATSEGEKELRRDSEKFSYNRTLAMLKFSENRAGARPGSAMTSATSSLASLHREEAANRSGLSPAVGGPGNLTPRDKKSRFLLA